MRTGKLRGFTLIEILILVVIMAVLACIVIPQYSSAAMEAKRGTAELNLNTMRTVIASYKAQHKGLSPVHDASAKSITVLLTKSRSDGTIDPVTGTFGPYLISFPENAFTGVKDVKAITKDPPDSGDVTAGNAGGWLYNVSAGRIWLDSKPGFEY